MYLSCGFDALASDCDRLLLGRTVKRMLQSTTARRDIYYFLVAITSKRSRSSSKSSTWHFNYPTTKRSVDQMCVPVTSARCDMGCHLRHQKWTSASRRTCYCRFHVPPPESPTTTEDQCEREVSPFGTPPRWFGLKYHINYFFNPSAVVLPKVFQHHPRRTTASQSWNKPNCFMKYLVDLYYYS